jgi:hypothetical protein
MLSLLVYPTVRLYFGGLLFRGCLNALELIVSWLKIVSEIS